MIKENLTIGTLDGQSLNAQQHMVIVKTPRLGTEIAVKSLKEWGQPKWRLTHLIFCSTIGVDMAIRDYELTKYLLSIRGRVILDGVEKKLGLDKDKMKKSQHVLSEYGNLTGACVLLILDEIRKRSIEEERSTTGKGYDYGVLRGFGQGIIVEAVVL
ncbi:Chitin synthase, class 3 [Ancistrocladus abbreviatus]